MVALPVVGEGRVVGVVAYVAPLSFQLTRFQALFNFPTAFIPASATDREIRPAIGGNAATDPGLRAVLGQPGSTHRAIYDAAVGGGGCADGRRQLRPRVRARPATSPGTSASRCRWRSSSATSAPTSSSWR